MYLCKRLRNYVWRFNEKRWLKRIRKKNQNKDFTLITNNCIAGIIYHNLGLQFKSPTINLSIQGEDYLNFVKNIQYYSQCELKEVENSGKKYPVGVLCPNDDKHAKIHIHFQHYENFEKAKKKWCERFTRVNYHKLYFIWEFYDELYDISLLQQFDKLNVKKMAILHRDIDNIKNSKVVDCYKEKEKFGKIFEPVGITGKRNLDEFDYVEFLNSL